MLKGRLSDSIEHLGVGLLGLVLPLVFLKSAEDAYRLPQLIALSLACLCLCLSWRFKLVFTTPHKIAAAFFLLRLLSHGMNGFQSAWVLEQSLYALIFAWASCHLGDAKLARRLKIAIVSGATIAALYAIAQTYGFDPFDSGRAESGFGDRAHSSLGNPDFLGGYLILALPFAFEWPLIVPVLILALVLSQTRAAWLAFAAGAALLPRRSRTLAAICAGAALLTFAIPQIANPKKSANLNRLASTVNLSSPDASGRLFMDHIALNVALKHPFLGVGGGHFQKAFLEEQGQLMSQPAHEKEPYRFTPYCHNDWLQLAAESGFAAMLIFGALVFLAFQKAWRVGERTICAALAAFSVNALLHFPLGIVPSASLAWLILGWSLAEKPKAVKKAAPKAQPSMAYKALALAPLMACVVFSRQLQGSVFLNKGMNLALGGDLEGSDIQLNAALKTLDDDERVWMRLGLNADARGDFAAAEAAFSHVVSTPEGLSNLALVKAKQGKLDEAKDACIKAILLNPKSLEATGNLGKIAYLKGDMAGAEAIYKSGFKIKPDWAQGHFNLAAIYLNTGRKAEARPQLIETLRLEPLNTEARRLLKELH